MNKSYCDEMWENLAPFLTECIFVGYTIRERRGKQTYEDSPPPPPPLFSLAEWVIVPNLMYYFTFLIFSGV